MSSLSNRLKRSPSFTRWIQRQDRQAYRQITLEPTWLPTTIVILIIIAIASWAPGARGFFHMHPLAAALAWVPALVVSALEVWYFRRPGDPLRSGDPAAWLLALFGAYVVQFWAASLVGSSSTPGSWVFVALMFYAIGFHGYSLRITREAPFALAGTVVTVAIAALLARSNESRLVLAILALPAAFVEWIAGMFAVQQDEARSERERMRAAIHAQMLEAEAARAQRLEYTLTGVLGRNHDANNSLMSAMLETEGLELTLRSPSPPPSEEMLESVTLIRDSLAHIKQLTAAIRAEGKGGMQLHVEEVDVHEACLGAAAAVRSRHPHVRIDVDLPESARQVFIAGGTASMRSIVENLLLNACQGDGERGAAQVTVKLQRVASGSRIQVYVDDDGPGFQREQLDRPVTAFATTKGSGTGLGLFTSERLLGASGGTLERGVSPFGGARVVVTLRASSSPTREPSAQPEASQQEASA